ncbi:MAG: LOG family protein [Anaerolineales bacterium]|nr:LOG family protein [Anaerolineales bacterium]MCX7608736.1 LOG family protein [Anaerolineales bacterium]MDW8226454.1 LOG family protein [Anaerolineales bacterium]
MNIAIFGGSQPKEGEAVYAEAYELGSQLARAGHTVLTGGYIGVMEAVSRGAAEAGGHVIGVTCEEIERWRPVGPNRWVKEEWRTATLFERLQTIITKSDVAIALPGGPGTLTEIALTWNLMIIRSLPPRPLILVGPGWRSVFEQFFEKFDLYTPTSQREYLVFAKDIHVAMQRLHA